MFEGKRVSVVLGGGGMRGLAHVGVLKVLERCGIEPDEYVGTSVGSLIGALAAGGLTPAQIEEISLNVRREDILDYNWFGLLWKRGRAASVNRGKALENFVCRILPVDRFENLKKPLFITAVDLHSAREIVWGMPEYRDVPIHDCVVASCSVPGVFPPRKILRHSFVDGSIVDTLPVKIAAYNRAEIIIASYLQSENSFRGPMTAESGMASIFEQSMAIWSRTLTRHNLNYFSNAPIVLIEPRLWNHGMFEFRKTAETIAAGERAAESILPKHPLLPSLHDKNLPPRRGPGIDDLPGFLGQQYPLSQP